MSDPPRLMLCTLVDDPFDGPEWLFEPKFDGLRVLCRIEGKRVQLISRNGLEQARAFPDVVESMQRSTKTPAQLDGEIVCLDEHGLSSFRMLQQRFHLSDPAVVAKRVKEYPAYIYLFDILKAGRRDVTGLKLHERKTVLRRAMKWTDQVRWTEGTIGRGKWLFEQMCRIGGEGIIAKRLDSTYEPRRSANWVKIKCSKRQELIIGGFTAPRGSRIGLGALLVGYYDDKKQLKYAGKVGTGFNHKTLNDLHKRLNRLAQSTSPFVDAERPRSEKVVWVEPQLVAEIAFSEWTQHGRLRHPRFEGLRVDKKASQVVQEKEKRAARVVKRSAKGKGRR